MKKVPVNAIFGLLVITAGVLFLLQNLGVLRAVGTIFWTVAFGVAGAMFLYLYYRERRDWWWLIPGFSLLGLATLLLFDALAPQLGDVLGAPIFLGAVGVSFGLVYLQRRDFWWAVIPGGVMLTLAVFVALESLFAGTDLVGVFFLGLAGTFVLVGILPTSEGRLWWAFIPAGVLGLMGMIFLATEVRLFRFIGPGLLVVGGAYLVLRTLRGSQGSEG
ncbi:MAG: hypothetical protein GTO14_10270 [Anaerolineales bacterium]|nr:hypothetical protein [Anaerolineales bacterium]